MSDMEQADEQIAQLEAAGIQVVISEDTDIEGVYDAIEMIGALVGVSALIPIAGAYIGAVVGAVMIFSVSPVQALIFLVFLVILQQLEGNLIYPRTVGSSLGLPGIWVLAAVTVGGGVMGVLGMIVFVPLTATVYRLLAEYVRSDRK